MRPVARNLIEGKVAARCGARAARIPTGRKWSTGARSGHVNPASGYGGWPRA